MRWTNLFSPTLREVPADAEVPSHQLLLRAGMIRQLGAGIYSCLPLARRSLLKIEQIIREEMDRIGGQEFYLPALHPAEPWVESGRWTEMGDNMFRLKDRSGRDMCLGMTHEEIFTVIARDELRSYKNLPQIWYQIQVKFRDEPRPKSGLLRVRQFTMKDAYSFDIDQAGLDASYLAHDGAYRAIFDRCGLQYVAVAAHSGAMGGSESQEFMVRSNAGEDYVVTCSNCGYSANLEKAVSAVEQVEDDDGDEATEEVHTPGRKTIDEVTEFLKAPRDRQIKSLVYIVDGSPQLILVRGDHQLSEIKLAAELGTDTFRPALPEEIREAFGADPGSLGPVGLKDVPVLADSNLQHRRHMICGANKDNYHLLHVHPARDFEARYADLREVADGEPCDDCGEALEVAKALEVGHIFKLGYKYSKSMGLTVLDQHGKDTHVIMGSYGIGVERIMASAVELYHDDLGIVWPRTIAPFQVLLTVLQPQDEKQLKGAEDLCAELERLGIDCLIDDRPGRPGVKFKDAELIGFPVRVTFGRGFSEGVVELFSRARKEKSESSVSECVAAVQEFLENYPL